VGLPQGITRELLQKLCESVAEASMMGSLVRLEEHFRNIEAERLRKAIDDYVVAKAKQGIDESYFGNETTKVTPHNNIYFSLPICLSLACDRTGSQ
jgi:hypothetical protein